MRYAFDDARPILRRASAARPLRVALGEVAARLERPTASRLVSHTVSIGTAAVSDDAPFHPDQVGRINASRVPPLSGPGNAAMIAGSK